MKKTYLILLVFISTFAFAQDPLLVEDFNYTAGDLLTAHGWTAHSGTTAPIAVTSPGLTFAGYIGSGIGLATGLNNNGMDVNKPFSAQTSGSLYTSFLVNSTLNTGAGGYFFMYRDEAAGTAFRARTFIRPETGKMRIGFSFNASAYLDSIPTLLNFGETYLFVVKYKIIEGIENDIVSLYVFKAGDDFTTEPTTPTIGPLTATRTTPGDPSTPLGPDINANEIALRQFETAQKITVDGFRVKTNWDLKQDLFTGINERQKQQTGFYPNPVTDGCLNIKASGNSEKQVEIFDLVGKKVLNQNTSSNKIDVKDLKAGVYVLKVVADNKTTTSKLIIK